MKTHLISIGSELSEHIFNQNESNYVNPVVVRLINCLTEYEDLETISSFHPLGFIHINLPSVTNSSSIRFHIWPDDIKVDKTPIDIHDHYYNINSYVICGKMQNNSYNIIPDTNGRFCLYRGVYNSDKTDRSLIKSDLIVDCSLNNSETISGGSYYFIDRDNFHNSRVNEFTSTIILANNFKHVNEPKVIGDIDGPSILNFPKRSISRSVIINNLQKVKAEIENRVHG